MNLSDVKESKDTKKIITLEQWNKKTRFVYLNNNVGSFVVTFLILSFILLYAYSNEKINNSQIPNGIFYVIMVTAGIALCPVLRHVYHLCEIRSTYCTPRGLFMLTELIKAADSVDDFCSITRDNHVRCGASVKDLVRLKLIPVRYANELICILEARENFRKRKSSFLNLPSTVVNKKIEDEFNAEDEDLEKRYKDLYSKFIKHIPTIDISADDF